METNQTEKVEGRSQDLIAENIKQLGHVFPEVVKEGRVDMEALKDLLGDYQPTAEERYCLNWAGKADARREAQKRSSGTLLPCKEESKDWETTGNLYIEGENLEVLKLLQKSYHGRIKMIYIDPPYNTGKDFVYKDNYKDNLENYLKQIGKDRSLSTKALSDSDGRFHSKWLNMMYPRLKLARNLLKDDGVMFISIDDNEVDNLMFICKELFGYNMVEAYIWDVREPGTLPKTAKGTVRKEHEYLVACYKSTRKLAKYGSQKYINAEWDNPDNDPRGPWMSANISRGAEESSGGSKSFVITNPAGISFDRDWAVTEKEYEDLLKDNRIFFADNGNGVPRRKIFTTDYILSIQSSIFQGLKSSQSASDMLEEMFGFKCFDYPKPVELCYRLLQIASESDSIILDFFSGSSSMAHAVMQINGKEEGSKRKFIMVQLPEAIDPEIESYKQGYHNICELGKERIRRAGKMIKNASPLTTKDLDVGFRVYKLDSSNVNAWDSDPNHLEEALQQSLFQFKEGRTDEDLLYEILLKYGIDLTVKVTKHEIEGNTVYEMNHGELIACLADNLTKEVAEGIGKLWEQIRQEQKECRVVLKDAGFKGENGDEVKTNSLHILKQHGINNVATI